MEVGGRLIQVVVKAGFTCTTELRRSFLEVPVVKNLLDAVVLLIDEVEKLKRSKYVVCDLLYEVT